MLCTNFFLDIVSLNAYNKCFVTSYTFLNFNEYSHNIVFHYSINKVSEYFIQIQYTHTYTKLVL